jgi:Leucine-rich repeat (LRR) protein
LTNLGELYLEGNSITDATSLAGLNHLQFLDLSSNPMINFASLSAFTNLTSLFLRSNSISDLTFLQPLAGLYALDLKGNSITNVAPLTQLMHLNYLFLDWNTVATLAPLSGLTNLSYLSLQGNSITDLAFSQSLPQLVSLLVDYNRIADLSTLAGLYNLRNLTLIANRLTNIAPLLELPQLTFTTLAGNRLDLSPGSGSMQVITELTNRGGWTWYLPQREAPVILANTNLAFRSGSFGFDISGSPGFVVVEASTNLSSWIPAATNIVGHGPVRFTDPASPNAPRRFYRVFAE